MENIQRIPGDIAKLIPLFDGDKLQLNLFLKKCEYVISQYSGEDPDYNLYVFHVLTSRLLGKAAALVGERDDIGTWQDLKDLLIQHFGDPRSENCIALELENSKIKFGESYLDFANRIQTIRSALIAKVMQIEGDENLRNAKKTIYTNLSLQVFIYNLNPELVRLIRLKDPKTLEDALGLVLEETNFKTVYDAKRNHSNQPKNNPFMPNKAQNNPFLKAQNNPFLNNQYNKNHFNNTSRNTNPFMQNNRSPFINQQRPFSANNPFNMNNPFAPKPNNFGSSNPFMNQNQAHNFRPQFGFRPSQMMHRPSFGNNQHNPNFGYNKPANTDVTMRTAPMNNLNTVNKKNYNRNNKQRLNTYDNGESSYYMEASPDFGEMQHNQCTDNNYFPPGNAEGYEYDTTSTDEYDSSQYMQNFQIGASHSIKK